MDLPPDYVCSAVCSKIRAAFRPDDLPCILPEDTTPVAEIKSRANCVLGWSIPHVDYSTLYPRPRTTLDVSQLVEAVYPRILIEIGIVQGINRNYRGIPRVMISPLVLTADKSAFELKAGVTWFVTP